MAARKQGGQKSTGKIVTYVVVGLVAAAGFFYLMKHAGSMDTTIAEKTTASAKASGGGDLGHIAELYDVLDKTDPDKMRSPRMTKAEQAAMKREAAQFEAEMKADIAAHSAPQMPTNLATVEWNMDLDSVQFPAGRANGSLSGINFVVDVARLDRAGYSQILTLRQGDGAAVNGELFIYLSISPSETVTNRTWTVTKDMKGKGVPQIIKRWKTNPRYAPVQKAFSTGYTMKLEMGSPTNGVIPGKIALSLPDAEKSVVAGEFQAETALYQSASSVNYNNYYNPSAPAAAPAPMRRRR